LSRRTRVMNRLRRVAAAAVAAAGVASSAAADDRGEVRIVAIAPADCRLAQPPGGVAASELGAIRLACNTPSPAAVKINLAGLGGGALLIGGKAVAPGADGAATLSPDQLASRADWRLQGVTAGAMLELTIVAN